VEYSAIRPLSGVAAKNSTLRLSPRERQIVDLLMLGAENAEIAKTLHITVSCVKHHFKHIFRKNGIVNGLKRVKLAVIAYREENQ
jgi:DNA-binding NarL/FixJ family response regulator